MNLSDIAFLASPPGQRLLERLTAEDLADANSLKLITTLRREYSADESSAALEMARLRLKAVDKFGDDAQRLFFTRDALEQASDPLIRAYRAKEAFRMLSHKWAKESITSPVPHLMSELKLVDACCGIGAESLAFTRFVPNVLGLDLDAVRIEIARYNAAALSLNARFEVADIRDGLPDADIVFFDPARRDEKGNRIYDVERYVPPFSTIRGWKFPLIVVKLSPGVDLAQLADYDGTVEFISVDGDLKEAVLWLGLDRPYRTFATLLSKSSLASYHWYPSEQPVEISLSQPHHWLVEPDPAVIRAGLVQNATAEFYGYMLDETIAYFTTDDRPNSLWVRAWQILDWMPFNLKKLRAYLREHNVGTVTVKKRGSAITPESLIPQLKLKGGESRTLVLTRCQGQHIVIICADYLSS
jgi:hypothetical protein